MLPVSRPWRTRRFFAQKRSLTRCAWPEAPDAGQQLVDDFLAVGQLDHILFNHAQFQGVRPYAKYDDHLHIDIEVTMRKILMLFLALSCVAGAAAQDNRYPLTGQMIITGEEPWDPPPDQKNDRAGLFLTGESAEKLYKSMAVKPTNGDVCKKGLLRKEVGALICENDNGKSYHCSVAILLSSGQAKQIGTPC